MGSAAVNGSIIAFMYFSGAIIILGLFFAGVHVSPDPAKSAATVSIICKIAAIGELLGGIILLLFSPIGQAISLYFGTLICFFGLLFLMTSWVLEKGGDLRPLGTFLLFTAVALAIFGSFAGMVPGMAETSALLWLVVIACILSWVGSWGWSDLLGKIGGWLLVVVGFWGLKIWAVMLFEGSIKVMLGG